jgi:hypothetical protein
MAKAAGKFFPSIMLLTELYLGVVVVEIDDALPNAAVGENAASTATTRPT